MGWQPAGSSGSSPDADARTLGYQGWTMHPYLATAGTTPVSGELVSSALWLPAGVTISEAWAQVKTVATTQTHFWVGLYSLATTPALLASSADEGGSFGTSTGWASVPLAYTTTAAGFYQLADLSIATTPPVLARATLEETGTLLDLPAPYSRRFGYLQSGLSALPSDLSGAGTTQAAHLWIVA